MDQAVLEAYGWGDIDTECKFILDYEEDEEEDEAPGRRRKKKPWRYRWPDEVLARLLELNAERARDEAAAAEGSPAGKGPRKGKGGRRKRAERTDSAAQADLFDGQEG
jgi:hypothetical protein